VPRPSSPGEQPNGHRTAEEELRHEEMRQEVSDEADRRERSRLDRYSYMTIVAIIASFIVVGIGVQAYLYQQAEQDDARTACLNANEARQANLSLWTYILDLSAANREEKPTPAEQQQIDEFKNWVGDLYAPRDCDDLSKRYKIPPPPILTGVPDEQAQ
jgi:hypothetical protein